MTIDEVIGRFLAVWGEPKSDHAEQFLAEYRRSLAGTSGDVLKAAADSVIDHEDYWPRPAALRRHVNMAAARLASLRKPAEHQPMEMAQPTEEQRQRVAEIVAGIKRRLAAGPDMTELPSKPVIADRVAFGKMRRETVNDHLHRVDHVMARGR